MLKRQVYKAEIILFAVQVSVIFIVICTSLANLMFENGNKNLWTVILTSSLGYILPNPKITLESIDKKAIKDNTINQELH